MKVMYWMIIKIKHIFSSYILLHDNGILGLYVNIILPNISFGEPLCTNNDIELKYKQLFYP